MATDLLTTDGAALEDVRGAVTLPLGSLPLGAVFRWLGKTEGLVTTIADFIVQEHYRSTAGDLWVKTLNTLTQATYTLPGDTEVEVLPAPAAPQVFDGRPRVPAVSVPPVEDDEMEVSPEQEEAARLAYIQIAEAIRNGTAAAPQPEAIAVDGAALLAEAHELDAVADALPRRDAYGLTFAQVYGDEPWPEPTDAQRAERAEQRFDMLLRDRDEAADLLEEARDCFAAFLRDLPARQEMKADDLGIINRINAALRKLGRPV